MDVADWLKTLGLAEYASLFRDNHVDADLLPHLTADDLKELGAAAEVIRSAAPWTPSSCYPLFRSA